MCDFTAAPLRPCPRRLLQKPRTNHAVPGSRFVRALLLGNLTLSAALAIAETNDGGWACVPDAAGTGWSCVAGGAEPTQGQGVHPRQPSAPPPGGAPHTSVAKPVSPRAQPPSKAGSPIAPAAPARKMPIKPSLDTSSAQPPPGDSPAGRVASVDRRHASEGTHPTSCSAGKLIFNSDNHLLYAYPF